jgi:hypothetical protein
MITHQTGIRFVLKLDELPNWGRRREWLIPKGRLRLNVAVRQPQNQHQRLALLFFFSISLDALCPLGITFGLCENNNYRGWVELT